MSVPFATPSDATDAASSLNDDFRDDNDEEGGVVVASVRPVVNADAGSAANAARRSTNFIVS